MAAKQAKMTNDGLGSVDHFRSLPPIYRSIDGDLYIANRKQLETEDESIRGEEFESIPSEYFLYNLGRHIQWVDFQHLDRTQGIWQQWVAFLLSKRYGLLKIALQTVTADEIRPLLNYQTYKGMGFLYLLLVFVEDTEQRAALWQIAVALGFQDLPDFLGATARQRAHQLGQPFPDTNPSDLFRPYWGISQQGTIQKLESPTQSIDFFKTQYQRHDIRNLNRQIERDLWLYLILFIDPQFSVQQFNQRQLAQFQQRYGITPVAATGARLAIANLGHTDLGADHLGIFAMDRIQRGEILHLLQSAMMVSIKIDYLPQKGDALLSSNPSAYAYHFLPYEDTVITYRGQLLWPMATIRPEDAADLIMFINDSGKSQNNNSTWIHMMVDGLPAICFVATQDILPGFEVFGNYISDSDIWASVRGLEVAEIPVEAHPHMVNLDFD